MKKTISAFALILASSLATGCIISGGEDSSLTIDNASSFALVDIAVRGSADRDYSGNLLGNDVLLPNETITVLLDCDNYDVLIIDEDNFRCDLINFDLCFDDAIFTVTNGLLNSCGFVDGASLAQPVIDPSSDKPFSDRIVDARKTVEQAAE